MLRHPDQEPREMPPRSLSSTASPIRRPAAPRGHGGASSLLRLGVGAAPQSAPASLSQRPFVLTRPHSVPQQMSLFGPPGGSR
jgi:hypothetical protein